MPTRLREEKKCVQCGFLMPALSNSASNKLIIALALYLGSLFASNTLGVKLMPVAFGLHVSVAIIFFPFVFIMTDVVGEVYGKRMARLFVLAGFVSTVLFIFYNFISLLAPWDPSAEWVHSSYNTVFGLSLRIAVASVVAFVVGEYQDVIAFFFVRDRWGTSKFWLRSNLSNLWSQLIDTVLFATIAFAGVYPNALLLRIIISWWIFKVLMGVFYTPLSYLGIRLLRDDTEKVAV